MSLVYYGSARRGSQGEINTRPARGFALPEERPQLGRRGSSDFGKKPEEKLPLAKTCVAQERLPLEIDLCEHGAEIARRKAMSP